VWLANACSFAADRHDVRAAAIGIARDATPAGEKFCEILRQISSEADREKSKPLSKSVFGCSATPCKSIRRTIFAQA